MSGKMIQTQSNNDVDYAVEFDDYALILDKGLIMVQSIKFIATRLRSINLGSLGLTIEDKQEFTTYIEALGSKVADFLKHAGNVADGRKMSIRLALSRCFAVQGIERKQLKSQLDAWLKQLTQIHLLLRDISNLAHIKLRVKDRKLVSQYLENHQLTRIWKNTDQREQTKLISRSLYNKHLNREANAGEILLARSMLRTRSREMTIEPTSQCNYKCSICSHSIYNRRPVYVELSDAQIEALLPAIEFLDDMAVQVSGEPTLSPQLGKLSSFASLHAVLISMITNGSLLHATTAILPRFWQICISFDGATKDVFERQRVGSNFELVVRNLKTLRQQSSTLRLGINVCVTRLNFNQLDSIVCLVAEIGVNFIQFNMMFDRNEGKIGELAVDKDDYPAMFTSLEEAKRIAAEHGIVVHDFLRARCTPDDITDCESIKKASEVDKATLTTIDHKSVSEMLRALVPLSFPPLPGLLFSCWPAAPTPKQEKVYSLKPLVTRDTVEALNSSVLDELRRNRPAKVVVPYCMAPFAGGLLLSSGYYSPCCALCSTPFFLASDPLGEDGFDRVWNSAHLVALRKDLLDNSRLPRNPTCAACTSKQRYRHIPHLLRLAYRLGYRWEDIDWPMRFNPPSQFHIHEMRDTLFRASRQFLAVGRDIPLGEGGEGMSHLVSGFSEPRKNVVWTSGHEATFEFHLSVRPSYDLSFNLSAALMFQDEVFPDQQVKVSTGGVDIANWMFVKGPFTTYSARIPRELVTDNGRLELTLLMPDAISQFHLGLGFSTIQRSIQIASVQLYSSN